jgi:hypothetical protein
MGVGQIWRHPRDESFRHHEGGEEGQNWLIRTEVFPKLAKYCSLHRNIFIYTLHLYRVWSELFGPFPKPFAAGCHKAFLIPRILGSGHVQIWRPGVGPGRRRQGRLSRVCLVEQGQLTRRADHILYRVDRAFAEFSSKLLLRQP